MNCLLDTSTLIWALTDRERLSFAARDFIFDSDVLKHVSVISFYEIAIKISIGKLKLHGIPAGDLPRIVYDLGVEMIVLEPFETISLSKLPLKDNHRDPFDRMLICQAIRRNLTLIGNDKKFAQYREHGLSLIW